MAVRINQLPVLVGPPAADDLVPLWDTSTGTTVYVTAGDLASAGNPDLSGYGKLAGTQTWTGANQFDGDVTVGSAWTFTSSGVAALRNLVTIGTSVAPIADSMVSIRYTSMADLTDRTVGIRPNTNQTGDTLTVFDTGGTARTRILPAGRLIVGCGDKTLPILTVTPISTHATNVVELHTPAGTVGTVFNENTAPIFKGMSTLDATLTYENVRVATAQGSGQARLVLDAGSADTLVQFSTTGGTYSVFNANDFIITFGTGADNTTTRRIGAVYGNPVSLQALTLNVRHATMKGFVVKLPASPEEDAVQIQDSTSAAVSGIDEKGAFRPPQLADADALAGTIYYSTTANKLVFKDPGGTVNNLY